MRFGDKAAYVWGLGYHWDPSLKWITNHRSCTSSHPTCKHPSAISFFLIHTIQHPTSLYPVFSKNIALHRVYWHFIIHCICDTLYLCVCVCVFVCQTPGNIISNIPVPSAFRKYSTCMVHSGSDSIGRDLDVGEWWGAYAYCMTEAAVSTQYTRLLDSKVVMVLLMIRALSSLWMDKLCWWN